MTVDDIGAFWYRAKDLAGDKKPLIVIPRHQCYKCKRVTETKKVAGTGTSRHNPHKWICHRCLGEQNASAGS